MPRSHAITTVFIAMAGDRRCSIRSNEDVPEHAEATSALAVSSSTNPLYSHVH